VSTRSDIHEPDVSAVCEEKARSGADRIASVVLSRVDLPLSQPISDAKVFTGRQKPLTSVSLLFAEIETEQGLSGIGFTYSKRAGGLGQYAHAREVAPEIIGEDPNDVQRIWTKLVWAGASVGRSGLATQAIAALDIALWDLKARRACLPLAKLLGAHRDAVACYNTSGGFLSMPLPQVLENTRAAVASGIGGIKIKVGHPDHRTDLERVTAVRAELGDGFPLMVDANQQWDRSAAIRMGRALEELDLVWIEEPLDAYDAVGHAALARELATPIASGEMLTSPGEHEELLRHEAVDFLQPDAPRVGGITPFLAIMARARQAGVRLAPHFAMEIHLHLAAAYELDPWVEHFDWLQPLFPERLEIADGHMLLPSRPGLGFSLSDQARAWTTHTARIDRGGTTTTVG
jgi:L-alanine-DL-glutamate epimerase-like enolase superfamily enzyme